MFCNSGAGPKAPATSSRWTFSEVGGLDTTEFIEPDLVHYPTFDLRGDERRMVPAFIYRPRDRGRTP